MRTLVAFIGFAGVLTAAAFGATRNAPDGARPAPRPGPKHPVKSHSPRLPRPRITQHPEPVATSVTARFAFTARESRVRFGCRLDGGRWRACHSPIDFTGLTSGSHTFSVRGTNRRGERSRPARFRWTLLEPRTFLISPRLAGISHLYPGAPPIPLPLVVENPNPVPIFVTSLRVSVVADPTGCAGAENLALSYAGASNATPLEVPAGGSVSLPATGISAPTIQLRDLPVNQDACQNARFPLEFSGSARG
jgi:hypothetical protein